MSCRRRPGAPRGARTGRGPEPAFQPGLLGQPGWLERARGPLVITYVATSIAGPNTDVWHGLTAANVLAPVTAQSALVEVRIPATTGAAAGHIDDVFFGLHGTPVELQELSIE